MSAFHGYAPFRRRCSIRGWSSAPCGSPRAARVPSASTSSRSRRDPDAWPSCPRLARPRTPEREACRRVSRRSSTSQNSLPLSSRSLPYYLPVIARRSPLESRHRCTGSPSTPDKSVPRPPFSGSWRTPPGRTAEQHSPRTPCRGSTRYPPVYTERSSTPSLGSSSRTWTGCRTSLWGPVAWRGCPTRPNNTERSCSRLASAFEPPDAGSDSTFSLDAADSLSTRPTDWRRSAPGCTGCSSSPARSVSRRRVSPSASTGSPWSYAPIPRRFCPAADSASCCPAPISAGSPRTRRATDAPTGSLESGSGTRASVPCWLDCCRLPELGGRPCPPAAADASAARVFSHNPRILPVQTPLAPPRGTIWSRDLPAGLPDASSVEARLPGQPRTRPPLTLKQKIPVRNCDCGDGGNEEEKKKRKEKKRKSGEAN